jgi:hypothetical protein
MATLIQDSVIHHDTVVINDIDIHTNEKTTSTLDLNSQSDNSALPKNPAKTAQLKMVDDLFGPIEIGSLSVTRVSLDILGATIDGQSLNGRNTFFRTPKRSFINSLQFNPANVELQMRQSAGTDSYLLPSLLFEVASRRPLTAPPVMKEAVGEEIDADGYRGKLQKLLNAAQRLDLRHAQLPRKTHRWVNIAKSTTTLGSSLGIQGFGIYMGLRGIYDGIRTNNTDEIVINTTGLASELGSIAVDIAVTRSATQMLKAGHSAYTDFVKTRFAIRLSRSGGLVGGALTLPFDIYTAVRSFNAADNAKGKEAIDHYVSAGLSIASAGMTVILGLAALAGFSFAGPVGLLAGALLAVGSQIYGAVRIVDDIDDYIELTDEERWRTGWFSFVGKSPDKDVQDRYSIAKATVEHSRQLKRTARRLLDGTWEKKLEAVVNGAFEVELEPSRRLIRNWWTKQDNWETVDVPKIKGRDDTIDARDGVTSDTPGAELGTAAAHKGVIWFIGDGKDVIKGVKEKPNTVHYGAGKKDLTGGEKDDRFVFEAAGKLIETGADVPGYSKIRGGSGNDTLVLEGNYISRLPEGSGYDVDLQYGTLHVSVTDSEAEDGKKHTFHSLLESIENIQTVPGATSTVNGTDGPNIIRSQGRDTITAGGGDDQIVLSHTGASAHGNAGMDTYIIAHVPGDLAIFEDGEQASVIALNWRADQIESWAIKENSLVITSRFDFYEMPRNVVSVHDIYQQVDSRLTLKNNQLTFITKDDFHLVPDLPETIEHNKNIDVQAVISKVGRRQGPIILNADTHIIKDDRPLDLFIPKTHDLTTLYLAKKRNSVTRLFVDYSSAELSKVEARFGARISDANGDLVVGCDLSCHFADKSLLIKGYSTKRGGMDPMNLLKILRAMDTYLDHKVTLVFKDGVAANLRLTPETEAQPADAKFAVYAFTEWTTPISLPLQLLPGDYAYDLTQNEPYQLKANAGCAKLYAYALQPGLDTLEGQGSTYLVHLAANMHIRLCTPGALASSSLRLPFASTWDLDATELGKVDITLENNQLQIGTCVIHLPTYDSEDLIDQVRVITEKGIVHTVDLSFDWVYQDGLDARFFEEPDATAALPDEFASVADKVLKVRYIALADNEPGTLSYSLPMRRWILDSDKRRVIDYSQLQVFRYCTHQRPSLLTPAPPLIEVPAA